MPIFFRFQQSGRPPSNRPGGSGRFPVQRGGGQSNTQNNYHQQRLRTPYNNQSSNGPMNNGGPSGDNRNNQANRSNYNSNNSSGAPMSNNRNRPNNERPGQQNKSQVIGLSFFFASAFTDQRLRLSEIWYLLGCQVFFSEMVDNSKFLDSIKFGADWVYLITHGSVQ